MYVQSFHEDTIVLIYIKRSSSSVLCPISHCVTLCIYGSFYWELDLCSMSVCVQKSMLRQCFVLIMRYKIEVFILMVLFSKCNHCL